MKKASKQDILKSVFITDLAKDFKIPLEKISSGNFTHRCKCPSPEHKHGSERTGSLYIDSVNNNFYCFGCGASNNVIDFYILKECVTFSEAIEELSKRVDPENISSAPFQKKKSNLSVLIKISEVFRRALRDYPDMRDWIFLIMKRTDSYMESIDRCDIDKANTLYKSVKKTLDRRLR